LYIDPSKFRILEDEEAFKYEVERWYAPDLMGYNRLTESLWLERYAKIPTVHRLGNALRDQFYLVSGLGRPLISQILYEAKLDPLMRCSALKEEERIELFRICQTVVREVYEGKKKRFMPDDQKDVFGNEISFVNMKKNRKIWVVRAVQKAVEKPKAKVKTNTD
jgi:formamidopyrimidine-DNA glycosylase